MPHIAWRKAVFRTTKCGMSGTARRPVEKKRTAQNAPNADKPFG